MRACTITIPIGSDGVNELPALVIEPNSDQTTASILLFLHGKGEARVDTWSWSRTCQHQQAQGWNSSITLYGLDGIGPKVQIMAPGNAALLVRS